MVIQCVWEHSGDDTLLYAASHPGAYTRGATLGEALEKMPSEITSYLRWAGYPAPESVKITISQEAACTLDVRDADSDVLFETELGTLSMEEYGRLKGLALKSATDFQLLYDAIPDKDLAAGARRRTFYGPVPRTAREMYTHTRNVNAYYFGEIDVRADNDGTIWECRERGFKALEQAPGFLDNPVIEGSYGEAWSLRKVLRRFIWHDRIHARAMHRMAVRAFGEGKIPNPFNF